MKRKEVSDLDEKSEDLSDKKEKIDEANCRSNAKLF